jgi:hypothetical protein
MPKTTKCQRCQKWSPSPSDCHKVEDESGCEDFEPRFHEVKVNVKIRFYGEHCAEECNMLMNTNQRLFCRLFGQKSYLKEEEEKIIREAKCVKTIKEG